MQEMRGSRKICKIQHKYISWDITIGSRKSLRRVYNYKPWQTQVLQFWGLQVLQLFARTNLLVRKRRFNLVGLPSLHHCIERRMYQALPVDSSSPADRWKPPSWMLVRSTVRVVECTWTKWTKVQACSLQKLFIACGSTCRMVESCCSHIWQKDLDFAAAACSIRTESLLSMTHLQGTLAYPKFLPATFGSFVQILRRNHSHCKSEKQERERERERERESSTAQTTDSPSSGHFCIHRAMIFKKSLQSNLLGGWHPIQSPSIQYHRHFFAKLPSTERTLQYQVAECLRWQKRFTGNASIKEWLRSSTTEPSSSTASRKTPSTQLSQASLKHQLQNIEMVPASTNLATHKKRWESSDQIQ